MKFSECVCELSEVWIEWLKNYKICCDVNQPAAFRREAGEKCENLMKKRYDLIFTVDSYFKGDADGDQ
jgi:hypothetical protein